MFSDGEVTPQANLNEAEQSDCAEKEVVLAESLVTSGSVNQSEEIETARGDTDMEARKYSGNKTTPDENKKKQKDQEEKQNQTKQFSDGEVTPQAELNEAEQSDRVEKEGVFGESLGSSEYGNQTGGIETTRADTDMETKTDRENETTPDEDKKQRKAQEEKQIQTKVFSDGEVTPQKRSAEENQQENKDIQREPESIMCEEQTTEKEQPEGKDDKETKNGTEEKGRDTVTSIMQNKKIVSATAAGIQGKNPGLVDGQLDQEEGNPEVEEHKSSKRKIKRTEKRRELKNPDPYCPKCMTYVKDDDGAVVCEQCNAYYHYACAETNEEELRKLGENEFLCYKHTQEDSANSASSNKSKEQCNQKRSKSSNSSEQVQEDLSKDCKYQSLKIAYKNLTIRDEQITKTLQKKTEQITKIREENNVLRKNVEQHKAKHDTQINNSAAIEEKDEKLTKVEKEKDALQKELELLKEKRSNKANEEAVIKGELKLSKEHVKITKESLQLEKANAKRENENCERMSKEVKNLSKKIEEVVTESRQLKEENKTLTMHQATLRKTIADLKDSAKEAKNDTSSTVVEDLEQNKQLQLSKSKIKELNKEINTLKEEVGQYQSKLEILVKDNMTKERTVLHLCDSLETLKFVNKQLELNDVTQNRRSPNVIDISTETLQFNKNLQESIDESIMGTRTKAGSSVQNNPHREDGQMERMTKPVEESSNNIVISGNNSSGKEDNDHTPLKKKNNMYDIANARTNMWIQSPVNSALNLTDNDESEQVETTAVESLNHREDNHRKTRGKLEGWCKYEKMGGCKKDDCGYYHKIKPKDQTQTNDKNNKECWYFKKGRCQFGEECWFDHVKEGNSDGEVKSKDSAYKTTEKEASNRKYPDCKYGDRCYRKETCKFKHRNNGNQGMREKMQTHETRSKNDNCLDMMMNLVCQIQAMKPEIMQKLTTQLRTLNN